jgi:hypothetical protein
MPPTLIARAAFRTASEAGSSALGTAELIGIPLAIGFAILLAILVYAMCKQKEAADKELEESESETLPLAQDTGSETKEVLANPDTQWLVTPLSPLPRAAVRG